MLMACCLQPSDGKRPKAEFGGPRLTARLQTFMVSPLSHYVRRINTQAESTRALTKTRFEVLQLRSVSASPRSPDKVGVTPRSAPPFRVHLLPRYPDKLFGHHRRSEVQSVWLIYAHVSRLRGARRCVLRAQSLHQVGNAGARKTRHLWGSSFSPTYWRRDKRPCVGSVDGTVAHTPLAH